MSNAGQYRLDGSPLKPVLGDLAVARNAG